jgi:hypothetical protein
MASQRTVFQQIRAWIESFKRASATDYENDVEIIFMKTVFFNKSQDNNDFGICKMICNLATYNATRLMKRFIKCGVNWAKCRVLCVPHADL